MIDWNLAWGGGEAGLDGMTDFREGWYRSTWGLGPSFRGKGSSIVFIFIFMFMFVFVFVVIFLPFIYLLISVPIWGGLYQE